MTCAALSKISGANFIATKTVLYPNRRVSKIALICRTTCCFFSRQMRSSTSSSEISSRSPMSAYGVSAIGNFDCKIFSSLLSIGSKSGPFEAFSPAFTEEVSVVVERDATRVRASQFCYLKQLR